VRHFRLDLIVRCTYIRFEARWRCGPPSERRVCGRFHQPPRAAHKGSKSMFTSIDDVQRFSKERIDLATKAAANFSKGVQQIAAETADYSRKSLEQSTAAIEQLFGAKSIDKAIEIQSDYAKSAYEGFVSQATKLGELYANLAKDAFKPLETTGTAVAESHV
jgi:phasin family protein